MSDETKIESVMHPLPHSITTVHTLAQAKHMMEEHNIRHLPVRSGGDLVGVLTDRDISYVLSGEAVSPEELKVEDAYTSEPYIVEEGTLVSDVARRMSVDHFGCALVTKDGELSGIFTTVDACRLLAETLSNKAVQ